MSRTITLQVSETIGPRIREARHLAGMTQKQLAALVHVETIQVSRWERGDSVPSVARLERIAEALGVPVTAFFGEQAPPLSEQQLELIVRRMMNELQDLLERRSKPPEDQ